MAVCIRVRLRVSARFPRINLMVVPVVECASSMRPGYVLYREGIFYLLLSVTRQLWLSQRAASERSVSPSLSLGFQHPR